MSEMKLYLRFGNIPPEERSHRYNSGIAVDLENGVSVWNCAMVNGVPFPLLPQDATETAMADYFYLLLGDRPVYLVTGTELKERGSAGEPLLRNITVIRDYREDYDYLRQIYTKCPAKLYETQEGV